MSCLSKREQDVVRSVVEGLTNREIAHQLKLTEHTVKNYLFRIFDKLGVSSRVELVLHAFSVASSTKSTGLATKSLLRIDAPKTAQPLRRKDVVPIGSKRDSKYLQFRGR